MRRDCLITLNRLMGLTAVMDLIMVKVQVIVPRCGCHLINVSNSEAHTCPPLDADTRRLGASAVSRFPAVRRSFSQHRPLDISAHGTWRIREHATWATASISSSFFYN